MVTSRPGGLRLPARRLLWAAPALLLIPVVRQLLTQVLLGWVLALIALPLCRQLEKKLPPGLSAALALAAEAGAVLLIAGAVLPTVLRQLKQVAAVLPPELPEQLSLWAGELAPRLMGLVTRVASGLGRALLAPALAFYFLRDRLMITRALCLLVPLGSRRRTAGALREAGRELQGFLRGQGLTCLWVGLLTALGLGLLGIPGWLLLGLLMGVMELIPYLGPFLAAVPTALFALPLGLGRTLWALGVILAVQQLEGLVIGPRLMAGAARLHPVVILLTVSLGSMAFGVGGMLLALPAVLALRGALRGLAR